MSAVSDVLAFARAQAQTDSNGLTDFNGLLFTNEALADFRRRLVAAGVDAASIQEAYCDGIVPASGNGSTFLYPTDMLFLKAIEVNFSDTTPQNYLVAQQVDHSNIPGNASFSWLRQNQSTQYPLFADNGNWFEIFPAFSAATNTSQAIRIIYFQVPSDYSSTASTIAYPESLDYRILGWRVAANWLYSIQNIPAGDAFEKKYDERVTQLIATLSRGSEQPLNATPIQDSGWEY